MTIIHEPSTGDLAVARVRVPRVQHITAPGATLCGLWARTKLILPNSPRTQGLPLCSLCQRARDESASGVVQS